MDRKLNLDRAETFSFVNPWIRYFLFFFSFLFWVFSLLIVAIGVYAKVQKATDTVRDTFLIDPAVVLIVVGVVMFFITFCGCIGALRENIRLLKTFSFSLTLVFLTQLAIAILGFFYSDQCSNFRWGSVNFLLYEDYLNAAQSLRSNWIKPAVKLAEPTTAVQLRTEVKQVSEQQPRRPVMLQIAFSWRDGDI